MTRCSVPARNCPNSHLSPYRRMCRRLSRICNWARLHLRRQERSREQRCSRHRRHQQFQPHSQRQFPNRQLVFQPGVLRTRPGARHRRRTRSESTHRMQHLHRLSLLAPRNRRFVAGLCCPRNACLMTNFLVAQWSRSRCRTNQRRPRSPARGRCLGICGPKRRSTAS